MAHHWHHKFAHWGKTLGAVAGVILSLTAPQPVFAQAATPPLWTANEDDALLFDMRVRQWRLGNGVRGYQTNAGVCVDLADVVMALDVPVRVDPKSRRATGWFFAESRNFTLDYDSKSVQIGGKVSPLAPGDLHITPEGWCVSVTTLSEWIGVPLKLDMANAFIIVDSPEKLPFELAEERKTRAANVKPRQQFDLSSMPSKAEPYAMLRPPSVDVTLGAAVISQPGESTQLQANYEIFASGEIATASVDARFASDQNGNPQSLRLRAYRTDPDGGLFGPLKATHFEVGDVEMPGTPLVAQGAQGRGAFITNRPIGRGDLFDTTDFTGDLPRGWDAELYRNGELIAYIADRGTGLYEFRDIPMLFGQNAFEVRLYGPQGQQRTERRTLAIGLDSIPPKQTYYWAGVAQAGTDLIPFGNQPARANTGWRAGVGVERGLDARTSIGGSFYWLRQDVGPITEGRYFGEVSLRRSIGFMLGEAGLSTDFQGGYGFRMQAIGQIGQNNVRAESFWVTDGYRSDRYGRTLRGEHRLGFDRSVKIGGDDVPLHLEAAYLQYASGQSSIRVDGRATFGVGPISATANVGWQRLITGGFSGYARDELDGNVRVSGRWGKIRLRGETNFRVVPSLELRETSLIAEWQQSERDSFRIQTAYDARGDRARLGLSYIRQFDPVAISGTFEVATDGAFAFGISANFSLAPKSDGGFSLSSQRLAANGRAEAIVFYDENGDGRRQIEEPIEKQVTVVAGTAQFAETDDKGRAEVQGLTPFRPILIGIDAGSLPDPFVQPAGPGMVITPRPGVATVIELPLVAAGEVDGTLMAEGGRALSGVKLELLDKNDRVIATTLSEFDGFFLFEKVPYGQYRLRIGAESAAALDLDGQLDKPAIVGRASPTASLGIVAAKRQQREEVATASD
jgi:hypothetical protein